MAPPTCSPPFVNVSSDWTPSASSVASSVQSIFGDWGRAMHPDVVRAANMLLDVQDLVEATGQTDWKSQAIGPVVSMSIDEETNLFESCCGMFLPGSSLTKFSRLIPPLPQEHSCTLRALTTL